MYKLKFGLMMLTVGLFLAATVNAQPWMNRIADKENPNFFEIQKAANEYWAEKGIDASTAKKGKEEEVGMDGYIQYKRWEWYMAGRVSPTGEFPDPMIAYNEKMKFNSQSNGREKHITNITANWTPLGPGNPIPTEGGEGRLDGIGINPLKPSTIYVGAPDGGVWKTNNTGNSWTTTTDLLSTLGTTDFVIDHNDTSIVYIATGDGDHRDSYSTGVMKSTNGGATWNQTGLNWTTNMRKYINRLIMDPTNSGILLAGTKTGIMKTTDSGTTWTTSLANVRICDMAFKPGNHNIIYACGDSMIYRSTDNGTTFTEIYSNTLIGRIAIAVTAADTNYLYALLSDTATYGFYSLLRSANGGNTFTQMSNSPNIMGWRTDGSDVGGQGWYTLTMIASPTAANTIFIGGVNIWESQNGGTSWINRTDWSTGHSASYYVHADIHKLEYAPNGTTIYACTDGGIFQSQNGGSAWYDLSAGLSIMQFYSVSSAQTDPTVVQGGAQDNGTDLYSAGSWAEDMGGDGMVSVIDYTNDQNMYAEYYDGNLFSSNDGGISFYYITPSQPGAWVTPYILDPNNNSTIYAGYKDVWQSPDQGNTWNQLTFTLTGDTADYIMTMACAPSNSNYLYVGTGTNKGIISTSKYIYQTTNGGITWNDVTGTLPVDSVTITAIAIKASDPLTVWVTFTGYNAAYKVYKTTNGGSSWTNITNNLPNVPIDCIVFDKTVSTDRIFVGTDVGVYYTDNTMSGTWVDFNTGLPDVVVYSLDIQMSAGLLRAGTFGRGLWESSLSLSTNTKTISNISNCPTIYPNPTTGEVTIYLPSSGITEISILNTLGEKVYDSSIEAKGNSTYNLDLNNQAKGIYFISIKTVDGVNTEKLVLMN